MKKQRSNNKLNPTRYPPTLCYPCSAGLCENCYSDGVCRCFCNDLEQKAKFTVRRRILENIENKKG